MAFLILTSKSSGEIVLANTDDISSVAQLGVGCRILHKGEKQSYAEVKESILEITDMLARSGMGLVKAEVSIQDQIIWQTLEGEGPWEFDGVRLSRQWSPPTVYRLPGSCIAIYIDKRTSKFLGKDSKRNVSPLERWKPQEKPDEHG